jgi:hypothetical protein
MVVAGDPLGQVWRFALVQLLDDYDSVVRHGGPDAAAGMWRDAPPSTGDIRVDAAFAAMAEYLGAATAGTYRPGPVIPTSKPCRGGSSPNYGACTCAR